MRTSVKYKHLLLSENHISRKYMNDLASEGMEGRRPEQGDKGTEPVEHL